MGFNFSSNNSMTEFEVIDTSSTIYLGFASKPETNIFSQSSRSNEAPQQSNYRGVGLAEMLNAIENQKLHRCNGELALHVLDMIDLTMKAAQSGDKQNMRTTCVRPEIFLEDEIKKLIK